MRKVAKNLWFMIEPLFFDLIAHYKQPEVEEKANPFLTAMNKIVTKEEIIINSDLSYQDLSVMYRLYDRIIAWNIGSRNFYEVYHLVSDFYYDQLGPKDISEIALKLGHLNSNKERLEPKIF